MDHNQLIGKQDGKNPNAGGLQGLITRAQTLNERLGRATDQISAGADVLTGCEEPHNTSEPVAVFEFSGMLGELDHELNKYSHLVRVLENIASRLSRAI